MRMRKSIALSLMLLCSMGLVGGCGTKDKPATATEKYPDKPITLIVPASAGGTNDMMARSMEKLSEKYLGQPFIVKNVPGGSGTIGWNEVIVSKDDGYTLSTVTTTALLQPLYGEVQYHYPSALDPLVQVISTPIVAVTRSDMAWNNMRELVDYIKHHSGEVKFGHPGLGSGSHVVGEMIGVKSDINLPQVPFRGDSETLAALLGGHVQLIFVAPSSVKEHVKAGKVKMLGVATDKRMSEPEFSDVRTFQEQGIDVVFGFWFGIASHKGIPSDVKSKLLKGLEKIINDPEYSQTMRAMGVSIDYLGHEEFSDKWLNESERLRKIVKETGIAEKIASQKN